MDTQNTIMKIQSAVQNAPLESILETAESIAMSINIPFLPLVIKILKYLITFRPIANKLLGTSAQTAAFVQNVKNGNTSSEMYGDACESSEKKMAEETEREEILTMLDQMIEIAAEDGELSDEEKGYLIDIARELDMNEQVLLTKVKMKCLNSQKK